MEYLVEQSGNSKKIVIVASVAAVAIAMLVLAVIIVRRLQLPQEEAPTGEVPTGEVMEDGSVKPPVLQPGQNSDSSTLNETDAVVVENSDESVPDDLDEPELAAPLAPGMSRALTQEEKSQYGFVLSADIWIQTSSPSDGSPPEASFVTRPPAGVTRPPDADNDGLSDSEESAHGTDPRNIDSDGDGMTDGDEVHTYKTDPLKADTDGDGVRDHDEAEGGTDPLKP